ncbi:transposase [Nostoc sp.]|uniref:transposase n=1 Tax=Nostoc sp. TaxID=1180 RepID=UPI003FA5D003
MKSILLGIRIIQKISDVLGDREFCSVKLANWLFEQEVQFCLRLKKNEFIQNED